MSGLNFISGNRGKLLLIVDNQKYYKFRNSENFVTWRCTHRTCNASVRVQGDEIVKSSGKHKPRSKYYQIRQTAGERKMQEESSR